MCKHCNLYDRYGQYSKKFYCTKYSHYVDCDERACSKFEGDSRRSNSDVEKAREGRL